MKNLFLTACCLLLTAYCFSQTCSQLEIEEGPTSLLIINSYTCPLSSDKKFQKAKQAEKDVMIAAYNDKVLAGTTPPTYNSTMGFNIKKTILGDGSVEYAIGYKVGEEDFYSYLVCKNDTVYSCRNRGIVRFGTKENPLGYSIQGIQTFPLNMKVGDVLPSFVDYGFLFPESSDIIGKMQVFSHYEKQGSSRDFGFFTDTQTGQSGFGPYDKTPPAQAVFKTVDVPMVKTISVSSHAIQGVNQTVTGEKEVTVGGKKYKAFIIESESWSKTNIKTSYESAYPDFDIAMAEADKKLDRQVGKFMPKNYTNKLGYTVMSSTGWFVPQFGGAVKTFSYDNYGAIATVMYTSLLE